MWRSVLLGFAAASLTMPAYAADPAADKHLERQLRQNLQADPDDAVMLARLARIYATTDRGEKARRLYRALLSLDPVMLETKGGPTMSSHMLAQTALRDMEGSKTIRLGSL